MIVVFVGMVTHTQKCIYMCTCTFLSTFCLTTYLITRVYSIFSRHGVCISNELVLL